MNLDELEKLAEEATPGPWHKDTDNRTVSEKKLVICKTFGPYPICFQDATFIAAADPQTILKLTAAIRATKAMRKEALREKVWYTGIGCEYAEDVDEALEVLEKE